MLAQRSFYSLKILLNFLRAHYFWAVRTEKQRIDKVSYKRLCIKELAFSICARISRRAGINESVTVTLDNYYFAKSKNNSSEFSLFIPGRELHRR